MSLILLLFIDQYVPSSYQLWPVKDVSGLQLYTEIIYNSIL